MKMGVELLLVNPHPLPFGSLIGSLMAPIPVQGGPRRLISDDASASGRVADHTLPLSGTGPLVFLGIPVRFFELFFCMR